MIHQVRMLFYLSEHQVVVSKAVYEKHQPAPYFEFTDEEEC